MTDQDRYAGLKKLPEEPALKVISARKTKLTLPVETPGDIGFADLLSVLEERKDYQQALKVLAHSLPRREAVWWGCLGARDELGLDAEASPPPALAAAEAWVLKPGEETRQSAHEVIEVEKAPKTARLIAMAAVYADGTMGPGVLADADAPPNAVGDLVFGIMLKAVYRAPEKAADNARLLLDRGLDIARGGNGKVAAPAETEKQEV